MNDSNIQHLFNMDKERFLEHRERLRAVKPSAEYHRAELNSDAADLARGRIRLSWAAVLAALALISMSLAGQDDVSAFWGTLFAITFAMAGSLCLVFLFNGVRRRSWAKGILEAAATARDALEGEDGFLWRFEPFLQDWDHHLPREVRETLLPVCEGSKDGGLPNDRDALRIYWYWAAACEGRMNVAKAEMRW